MVAAAGLVLHLIAAADGRRLLALLSSMGPKAVLALLPFAAGMAIDTVGWRLLLGELGYPLRIRSLLRVRFGTESLALSLPAGALAAEVAKPLLLWRRHGVPLATGTASVTAKKALVISANAVYMATGLLLGRRFIAGVARTLPPAASHAFPLVLGLGVLLTMASGGLLLAALANGAFVERLTRTLARIPIARLRRWLHARAAGIMAVDAAAQGLFIGSRRTRRRVALAFVLFQAQWFVEALDTFVVARLCHLRVDFSSTLAFECASSFVRSVAFFLPGGLGIADFAQVLFVQASGSADAATVGAAFLLLKRLKEVFWIVTGLSFLSGTTGGNEGHRR